MTNTEKLSIFGLAAPNVYTDFRLADLMLWFCSHSFFLFFFILYEITVYVSRYHWLPLFPLGFTWVCTLLKFVLSVIVLGDLKQHTEISLSSQSKLYPATITTVLILDFFFCLHRRSLISAQLLVKKFYTLHRSPLLNWSIKLPRKVISTLLSWIWLVFFLQNRTKQMKFMRICHLSLDLLEERSDP